MKLIRSDYDPVTGFTEEFWFDDATNRVTIRRLQDVEGQLNLNKDLFNSYDSINYKQSDGLHKVATIPLVLIEKWMKEEGFNWYSSTHAERVAKLNNSDYKHLLVRPGRL